MRRPRRFIKTELLLPGTAAGRLAVIGSMVVGGTVALAMVVLFATFLAETFRGRG